MNKSRRWLLVAVSAAATSASILFAQETLKPVTNADVINMVKNGMPESIVVATIQSGQAKFDTSPDGLIALHKAGVTQPEMDALIAAAGANDGSVVTAPQPAPTNGGGNGASAPTVTPAAPVTSAPKSRMPKVFIVVPGGARQPLPFEKTQLAQTRTKPTSMTSLAGDSVVSQAMRAEIGTATTRAAAHMGSGMGGSTMQQAGSIFSGVMAHRKPTVTYVWAVPNPASTSILQTGSPTFEVNYSRAPGVNVNDYEPAIVKLTPAQNTCRIIGATQGKEDVHSSAIADWQIYSNFLEDRVAAHAEKLKTGQYKLSPASSLLPGEYAIVLRPISKIKKFSGADVARSQGDGFMFDALWSFQVSMDSEE